jgi:adenine deaminase
VPSAPGFEVSGATLGPEEIAEAMTWPGVIGLGEVMNFPAVYNNEENIHSEMEITRQAGKVIGGHYPSNDLGPRFHGYVAGGANDDHEGTHKEDAIARVRQGMKAMLRFGSAWHDVAEGVRAITEDGLDPRFFILCTDDSHCETLVNEGHVNRAVRQAILHGIDPLTAIQMTTLNTAEHFGVSRDVGMIAPGRFADILLVKDLAELTPDLVIARGVPVAENGKVILEFPGAVYPDWAINSVHLARNLTPADFRLTIGQTSPHNASPDHVLANVIGVIENQAPTRWLRSELPVRNGEVSADPTGDLAKVAVIDRHHASGRIQLGLVSGFGFDQPCAIGSTVAHDSHQMILVGTADADLALAANELARMGGGQIVVRQGRVIGELALPVAGLMATEPAGSVARQAASILDGFRRCGCQLNNPNMQLSLLGLVVIPDLRISNLGLVDVNQMKFVPLFESNSAAD